MRQSFRSYPLFATVLVLLLLISERPAHAYIDPGSGSLIYQSALALLLGVGFFFRRTVASIGRLFRGRSTQATGHAEPQPPEQR